MLRCCEVFFWRGCIRFGDCVFDASAHELRRAGQPVHLPPKAFQLLELLLAKRPRPVMKAEIRDALWPATAVGASSLARVVVDLRSAIGDDARHPRLLRTVHGFGYSFSAETVLEQVPGPEQLEAWAGRLVRGEREIALVEGEHVLGRLPDASVWIDSTSVSRRHARIVVSAGRAARRPREQEGPTWGTSDGFRARGRHVITMARWCSPSGPRAQPSGRNQMPRQSRGFESGGVGPYESSP